MTIHVDRFDSDVIALPPTSGGQEAGEPSLWQEVARLQGALARLTHLRQRTRAERFDD